MRKDSKVAKERRHQQTIEFLQRHVEVGKSILDLGEASSLTVLMQDEGYFVFNTSFDLDRTPELISEYDADVVTGFQILEHLIEPAPVLKTINSRHLVVSVAMPRRLENLYWNTDDEHDQHYHEFHQCQFDKLLRHCGWQIIATELWKSHSSILGRVLYPQPKYYIVYAKREET